MTSNINSSKSEAPQAEGAAAWLRRTLTNTFGSPLPRPRNAPTTGAGGQPQASITTALPAETAPTTALSITPFQRFLNVVTKRPGQPEFPPTEWFEPVDGVPKAEVERERVQEAATVPLPETPPLQEKERLPINGPSENADPPESNFIARKIQSFLTTFPPVYSSAPTTPSTSTSRPALVPSNLDGESKFVTWLSSPAVMNGSLAKGKHSVWSILDRLRPAPKGIPVVQQTAAQDDGKAGASQIEKQEPLEQSMADNRSSVMLYGPLLPDLNGQDDGDVELARSSILAVDEQDDTEHEEAITQSTGGSGGVQGPPQPKQSRLHLKKNTERVIWLPSDTKISLELMWWGYRIYLPPPVLDALDGQHANASKQAALLTTALKWILDRVPMLAIPPQFRTAFKLVRLLVPYLGYIGSFVAWSWGAIKGFDKGRGVTLTATWLLPVALIPSSWEESGSVEQ